MSLLNILSSKIADSVLGSNKTLPKMTSTTFAKAGTSLSDLVNGVHQNAKKIMAGVTTDNQLYAPILAMREYSNNADPSNAATYNTLADQTIFDIDTGTTDSLSNYDNSLYSIQQAGRESVASGVNNYSAGINGINPSISSGATGVGLTGLTDTGRTIDSSCSASYNSSNSYLSESINDINNDVVAKSVADNAAAENAAGKTTPLPEPTTDDTVDPIYADSSLSSGIDEGDPVDVNDPSNNPDVENLNQKNTTDIVFQNIKAYIEGVEVPIESCSITQAIGRLPSAEIQVPPQSGLMDIARYYQPKVHIFYTDANFGGDRLLFWGHITAVNFTRSQQTGTASIRFSCDHKNALMRQVTFEWSAGGAANITSGRTLTDTNPDQASAQVNNFNSEASIVRSLQGLTGLQTESKDLIDPSNKDVLQADPTKLSQRFKDFEQRLVGMPSVLMNLWNQVKLEVYANEKLNLIFSKIFVPLIEDGVRFFDRLSGHYFVENQINQSRVSHCNDQARPELSKYQTLLPPAFRLDIQSAVQTKLAISSLKNMMGFSGELMSFYDLFLSFYYGIEYEMLTLASPAEIPLDPTLIVDPDDKTTLVSSTKMAIETVIKPQLPFYYAPICNVLLPTMYYDISVDQNEVDIPTRITAIDTSPGQATNGGDALGLNYRAPQSIREAISRGRQILQNGQAGQANTPVTLKDTTGSSFNIPGKYELGRGIKHKKIMMPNWLSAMVSDYNQSRASNSDQEFPQQNTLEYKNLLNLHFAWIDRYGYQDVTDEYGEVVGRKRDNTLDTLDPYSSKSDIMAYERLLFSTADFEYTKSVVSSKTGFVSALFNPYIVPGYPMDIIDNSPNHPSFHAMCASVTHSLSPRFIGTSVSFMAAITYAEMSNYYIQPIHPWLQNALKMVNVARGDASTTGSSTDADASDVKQAPDPVTDNNSVGDDDRAMRTEVGKKEAADKRSASMSSTDYGLPADPAYDSNTGDVTSVQEGLIGNTRAKLVADQFYRGVLGVGAAEPSQLYDFYNGGALPVVRRNGIWEEGSMDHNPLPSGGEGNDNLTAMGGMRLVSRPIEGRRSIEAKFGIKFIDLTPQNYSGTSVAYENTILSNSKLLEPGASMFLDYEDITVLINSAYNPPAASTDTEESGT